MEAGGSSMGSGDKGIYHRENRILTKMGSIQFS